MTEIEYIENRVDKQMARYAKASKRVKRKNSAAQTTIISLGLIVPVAVNLESEWFLTYHSDFLQILVTVLSLILAIVSGIANFKKYGEMWLTYSATAESLRREKLYYLTSSEKYRSESNRFNLFVESVERILSFKNEKFQTLNRNLPSMQSE